MVAVHASALEGDRELGARTSRCPAAPHPVGGELIDGTGEVPLAEETEEYELEILDGPGGAVLRTEIGITTTSFTYTSGMQSADFGGAQTELSFFVYQISAQVGRGFASEVTVEIVP